MAVKSSKFRNSDELFLAVGLSHEELLISNFRVAMCIEIGKRLRKLAWTQELLSQRVGTSQANISRIVNKDIGKISTDLLLRVLVVVGGKAKIESNGISHKKAG